MLGKERKKRHNCGGQWKGKSRDQPPTFPFTSFPILSANITEILT